MNNYQEPINSSFFSFDASFTRLKRFDFITVYFTLIALAVLLLVVIFYGSSTTWYENLIKTSSTSWIVRGSWVVGTILSYVGFFWLWQDVRIHPIPRDFIVSTLFIISGFLFLGWVVALYYAQDIILSFWISIAIFVYNFWLFIYIWHLSYIAALFQLPLLALYIYLIYDTLTLASLNNIPI